MSKATQLVSATAVIQTEHRLQSRAPLTTVKTSANLPVFPSLSDHSSFLSHLSPGPQAHFERQSLSSLSTKAKALFLLCLCVGQSAMISQPQTHPGTVPYPGCGAGALQTALPASKLLSPVDESCYGDPERREEREEFLPLASCWVCWP